MNRTSVSLLMLALSASAFAAVPSEKSAAKSADVRAEHQAEAEARFRQSDLNHDGKLSFEEVQKARESRKKEMFAKADSNHDGGLSEDEMRAARKARMEQRGDRRQAMRERIRDKMSELDANKDQAWTRAELGDQAPRISKNFDQLDANHDGKLTRDELRAGMKARRDAREDAK